jgi:hypothetical protein
MQKGYIGYLLRAFGKSPADLRLIEAYFTSDGTEEKP